MKTVNDISAFNFVKNPFQKKTHICVSMDGFWICTTPAKDDRFKWQPILRAANIKEIEHHKSIVKQ